MSDVPPADDEEVSDEEIQAILDDDPTVELSFIVEELVNRVLAIEKELGMVIEDTAPPLEEIP